MMKQNRLFKKLFVLLLVVLGYTNMLAQGTVAGDAAPYAVLSDNNTVLTFYCDDQKTARNGMDVGPFIASHFRSWDDERQIVTSVVFDASFADCTTLTSTAWWFYDMRNLTTIEGISNLKTDNVTSMREMFRNCELLSNLDVSHFNTSNVTDMSYMFNRCKTLTSLDVSQFNTSNVTNMGFMFYDCTSLASLDVSGFNTENVTSMERMFEGCQVLENLDVSGFKTDKVTNMGSMFYRCWSLTSLDVSNFNTANVTNMSEMFGNCLVLPNIDVSGFNTENVTTMHSMFYNCNALSNIDVSNFNTAKVNDMGVMFGYCTSLTNLDVSAFNTANVTDMESMFASCSSLVNLELNTFNTEKLASMKGMFIDCSNLTNLDVSSFNTSNVTDMRRAFSGCSSLNSLDLSSFNTEKVADMRELFNECSSLATIYVGSGWSTAAVTNGNGLFYKCTSLVGGAGTHYDVNHTDYTYARIDGGPNSTTPGYFTQSGEQPWVEPGTPEPYAVLSVNNTVLTFYYDEHKVERNGMSVWPFGIESDRGWNDYCENITTAIFDGSFANCTSLTSTRLWFTGCQNLTAIQDLSNLKTDNVTDMRYMFKSCSSLTSLDVSGFKTDNVTNMGDMFFGCSKLTTLDLSNFNTSQVKYMYYMFSFCSELTSLDVSNFNTENVESMVMMFEDCSSLTSLNVSSFKTENVTKMGNMFNGCSGLTSLDVSNFNTSNVTDMSQMFSGCSSLTSLDVSNFNTSNVTSMNGMFSSCAGLTSLDVSSFKTDNVIEIGWMFEGCSNLKSIYAGDGWSTAMVEDGSEMFSGCTNLVGGAGTHYNPDHVDYTYARIDGGPNSQMPGYFTFKNAPAVDPNGLVLTGKIDNYWYDEAGNPDGFEAIIINVPLPPGEVSIWENNVLNTFVENKLAFTTQNGEPVDNVEGRILFTEKGHWKTIDGGRILIYEDANMQGEVAEIDPEWGMIRILNTDVTWSLLSATDRYVSLPLCVKAYIGDDEMPLTNGSFTVMLTKPLSIESISLVEISFENSQEVSVSLDELIHLQDWRNKQLVRNDSPDLYEYYRVDSPMITGTENGEELNKIIMTDLGSPDGSLHRLSEVATTFTVSYNPDLNHGTLTFVNYGNIPGSFTMYVPVTINHEWGYLSGQVIIKVHEGDMPVDAEPYAVLSNNNTVLTFYYDDKKAERNGMDVESFGLGPGNIVNSGWFGQRENITNVVFDDSFANCTDLEGSAYWFWECSNLTSVTGITNLKTDNMTQMLGMFGWCSNLTTLDVSHFNTEKNTRLDGMFIGCSKLTSIDVSGFNTSNVTDMGEMFMGCSSLTSIDVSNFNTSNVTRLTEMFQGCSSLTTLDLSNFLTTQNPVMELMFEGCTSLAAIQAGSAEIPAEEYAKIGNPNLLVYVNEARLAPEGVQNVVVNGVAKEIVLTDNPDGKIVNNNWYCPEPFRAEKISYTRDFRQQTQIGISRGWESLALPFAVQTITHQDKGAIAPFGSDASGLHFWLRRLGHEGLISVQMIEPNTPYIISMPNSEDYASRFNLNGRVTFAAEDAYVERTEQMADESADYMMIPAFQRMPVSEYVYALNIGEERNGRPEGSIFERNYREVRPFEAYTLHRGDQPAPLFFDLSDLEGSTTDMPDVRWMMDDGNGEWYDLQGRKLGSTLNVQRSTLKKGVYIRNGRKIVFK